MLRRTRKMRPAARRAVDEVTGSGWPRCGRRVNASPRRRLDLVPRAQTWSPLLADTNDCGRTACRRCGFGNDDIEPLAPSDHVTIRQRQQFDTACSMKNAGICRIRIFWCCVRNFLREAGRYSYIVHNAARSAVARHGRAWMPGIECRRAVRPCCRDTRRTRGHIRSIRSRA